MLLILDVKARETNNEQEDSNTSPLSVLMMSVKRRTTGQGPIFRGARFFMEKNPICICKIFFNRFTHTNTNIDPLTKLFLWFKLVINPFGIRFRPLVSPIPNFVKA
ncbi:hypothetical protein Hanom_Chr12g01121961 [Helianthus anomalus]